MHLSLKAWVAHGGWCHDHPNTRRQKLGSHTGHGPGRSDRPWICPRCLDEMAQEQSAHLESELWLLSIHAKRLNRDEMGLGGPDENAAEG